MIETNVTYHHWEASPERDTAIDALAGAHFGERVSAGYAGDARQLRYRFPNSAERLEFGGSLPDWVQEER